MSPQPIVFNNTVLRDGHQSLAATRMRVEDMIPLLGKLDGLGFNALETWGGATIDTALRFLGENPFERLRKLKEGAPKTPHMMLLRGQNIVQYNQFPDDVVELFIKQASLSGIDIFRIFDALNDVRNLRTAIRAVLANGKHAQGTVCYTTSPVHATDALVDVAVQLEKLGCQSVCVKDMAGLLAPPVATELVQKLKTQLKVPVVLHSHNTAGLAIASYYAAIDAGVDAIDTSIAPFANGTAQPDSLLMQDLLAGHPRRPDYDASVLQDLSRKLEGIYGKLSDFTSPENEKTNGEILRYQVPGGMLSNFRTQLQEQNMSDRLEEVLREVVVVREALGWIPLVTPTSQIVGTQALLNVKMGRWKMIAKSTVDVALGRFGKTPASVDKQLVEMCVKQANEEAISCRPADKLAPRVESLREELSEKGLPTDDDHVCLYAMYPQQVAALYAAKLSATPVVSAAPVAPAAVVTARAGDGIVVNTQVMVLTVNNRRYDVVVDEIN